MDVTGTDTAMPVFRLGGRGAAVTEVRDRLIRLGLLQRCPDEPADVFDAELDRAVRLFQQQRGLSVDGAVGERTFRRLEEARWQLGDRVLSYRAGRLVSGDDVATLQRRLLQFGFDLDRADGIFGPRTDAAVREFQRSVGVAPDGTCGPDSFRALTRLARTMGGSGNQLDLRELDHLDDLTTGVADKVVVLDPGRGSVSGSAHPPAVPGLTEAMVADDLVARVEGRLARDRGAGPADAGTGRRPRDRPSSPGPSSPTPSTPTSCCPCGSTASTPRSATVSRRSTTATARWGPARCSARAPPPSCRTSSSPAHRPRRLPLRTPRPGTCCA